MNGTTTLGRHPEWRPLAVLAAAFLALFFLPVGVPRFDHAVLEGLLLAKAYAREHVLLCLVPAFFIAGAIAVFVSDAAVLRYLGRGANRMLAYGVAAAGKGGRGRSGNGSRARPRRGSGEPFACKRDILNERAGFRSGTRP